MTSLYRYRIYPVGSVGGATEHIAEGRFAAESLIPHGESRIVKRYQGRKKLATYRVEKDVRGGCRWMQLAND